jgi:DNA invertase Pin-like site-specific DNA recombinase
MTPGKFTKKDIRNFELDLIKSLYAEGFSIKEIIEKVDLSFANVQQYLRKEGLLKEKKVLDTHTGKEIIIKLFEEGNSVKEIAYQTRISQISVGHVLKEAKLIKTKYFYGGKEFDTYPGKRQYQKEVNINVRNDYEKEKQLKKFQLPIKFLNLLSGKF